MSKEIMKRSGGVCELCKSDHSPSTIDIGPVDHTSDTYILVCQTCKDQIQDKDTADPNHWRCLNDAMWSEIPAVQVISYRMLWHLKDEGWPQDLLDMIYLDDDLLSWAKSDISTDTGMQHVDANGAPLTAGDTVTIIKDLKVKGTSFVAKRGTAVRRIRLVHDNPEHIEGKVEGQQIVILTKYVKKQ